MGKVTLYKAQQFFAEEEVRLIYEMNKEYHHKKIKGLMVLANKS